MSSEPAPKLGSPPSSKGERRKRKGRRRSSKSKDEGEKKKLGPIVGLVLGALVALALTYLFVPGAWFVGAGAVSGLIAAYLLAGDE